jgi:hypothetical protein
VTPTDLPPTRVAAVVCQVREALDVVILVNRLRNIHAMVVSAALALRGQNAEMDRDVSRALVHAGSEPLCTQIEALARVTGIELGGDDLREVRP